MKGRVGEGETEAVGVDHKTAGQQDRKTTYMPFFISFVENFY